MHPPLFVTPLSADQRAALRAGIRSPDTFTARRCQVVLASAAGQPAEAIAQKPGCSAGTARNAIRARNAEGAAGLAEESSRPKSAAPLRPPERHDDLRGVPRAGASDEKKTTCGGQLGLTLPDRRADCPGPAFVVEGASDTIALTHAGSCAVGRPTSFGKPDLLADLFSDWPADHPIVVGERDRKPNGDWPGRDGTERTAAELARRLGRPVL